MDDSVQRTSSDPADESEVVSGSNTHSERDGDADPEAAQSAAESPADFLALAGSVRVRRSALGSDWEEIVRSARESRARTRH